MKNILYTIIVTTLFIFGCVPLTQFTELKTANENCENKNDSLAAVNEKLMVAKKELDSKLEILEAKLKDYEVNDISGSMGYIQLQRDFEELKKQYNQLKTSQEYLLENSADETSKILTELQKTQNDLQLREDRLNKLEADLNRKKNELESKNKRLIELESILFRKDSVVTALKNKISNALLGFQNQGLTVTQKNGKVYVSLDEKLLFKTGSYEVDDKGKSALKKLAFVLEQNPDIEIMVEGHTDDVPYIPGSTIKDNWDLSVLRATSVVKILLSNSSINPKRLTASGHGQYLPVDPLKSDDARRKNRRTEIILSPKLDELYELIEKDN